MRVVLITGCLLLGACGAAKTNQIDPVPAWRTEDGQKGVWRDLAEWYIENGMPAKAMEMVTRLRETGSDNPELLLFQGRALSAQGMPEEARHVLEEAANQLPRDPRPLQALGVVYADLGDTEKAIEILKSALQMDEHVPTRNNLGFMLLATGRCEEATEELERVLGEDATKPRYRNNLAFSLVCAGQPQRALKLFRSVASESEARYNMGLAYERLEKYSSALLQYQHALEVDPEHAGALDALARLEPLELLPDDSTSQGVE